MYCFDTDIKTIAHLHFTIQATADQGQAFVNKYLNTCWHQYKKMSNDTPSHSFSHELLTRLSFIRLRWTLKQLKTRFYSRKTQMEAVQFKYTTLTLQMLVKGWNIYKYLVCQSHSKVDSVVFTLYIPCTQFRLLIQVHLTVSRFSNPSCSN